MLADAVDAAHAWGHSPRMGPRASWGRWAHPPEGQGESGMTEAQLRDLIPGVLAALVHRGADFATAEDAVQEALVRAVEIWPSRCPDDPKGWLITTAWRRLVDIGRSDIAGRRTESTVGGESSGGQ